MRRGSAWTSNVPLSSNAFPAPETFTSQKNRHHAELAHDRQQTLDHARPAKSAGRDTAEDDRFMDVLLQVAVQDVVEDAG